MKPLRLFVAPLAVATAVGGLGYTAFAQTSDPPRPRLGAVEPTTTEAPEPKTTEAPEPKTTEAPEPTTAAPPAPKATNVVDLVKVLQESISRSQSVRVKRGGNGAGARRRSTSPLARQKRRAVA